jgi:hypothetical protein
MRGRTRPISSGGTCFYLVAKFSSPAAGLLLKRIHMLHVSGINAESYYDSKSFVAADKKKSLTHTAHASALST